MAGPGWPWLAILWGNIPHLAWIFAGSFLSPTFAYRGTLCSEPATTSEQYFYEGAETEIFIVLRPRLVTGGGGWGEMLPVANSAVGWFQPIK